MRNKSFALLAALLISTPMTLSAQQTEDESYWAKDVVSRITLNGYAQAGYTYTQLDGDKTNTLDIKRTLLWAKARITDRWSFLFMHDFNSQVQEFYTDFRVTNNKALTIRFGQFKNQLSLENPLSPTTCELIDVYSQGVTYLTGCGSDPLFGIQYGRDLGIDLYGQLFNDHLYYNIEVMNGRGINAKDKDNKKDVIVKLDYRPIEGLRLVASAQKGYGVNGAGNSVYIPTENAIALGEIYRRDRWTLGVEWKSGKTDYWKERCSTIRGEVVSGKDGETISCGGYVTGSFPLVGNLDIIASYDYFNYAKGYGRERTMLVGGLQYWFFRKCRVQLQYTWADSWTQGLNTAWVDCSCQRIQLQTQIAF